jgi:hypothetical protein
MDKEKSTKEDRPYYKEGELTPAEAVIKFFKLLSKRRKPKKELKLGEVVEKVKVTDEKDWGPVVFKCKYLHCPFFAFNKDQLIEHYRTVHKEKIWGRREKLKTKD